MKFARPIAFDVIPLAGSIVDDGELETDEEKKLRNESRKILELPDLLVAGTCVRVPVFTGHSLSINAEFANADHARACHRTAVGCPGRRAHRRADAAAGRGQRPELRRSHPPGPVAPDGMGLVLFISNDNLRKGAALNAVQIAELVAAKLPTAV